MRDISASETDLPRRVLVDQDAPFDAPDVGRALREHWKTQTEWGGELREACGRCRYGDGVRYLWPCPTRRYLTGEAAPDPLPQDPELRAAIEARITAAGGSA